MPWSPKSKNKYGKDSNKQAKENRSIAWVLLVSGALGMVFIVLGILGIIPFKPGNTYLFYGVMSAVFILFIVMGVISMRNAKFFAVKAASENTLIDTLSKWCSENLSAKSIDAALSVKEGDADEALYFRRYEKIKELINTQFMNLDQAFVEHFIYEKVYDSVFGDEKKL